MIRFLFRWVNLMAIRYLDGLVVWCLPGICETGVWFPIQNHRFFWITIFANSTRCYNSNYLNLIDWNHSAYPVTIRSMETNCALRTLHYRNSTITHLPFFALLCFDVLKHLKCNENSTLPSPINLWQWPFITGFRKLWEHWHFQF